MPKRLLPAALALVVLLTPTASATWSFVVYDSATGEVAVASATCLPDFNLIAALPVIVVGKGAAAAQSAIDDNATNRMKIWDMFMECELNAAQINQVLKQGDILSCSRQYGIVNNFPSTKTFTGNCASAWKGGEQGTVGTITYAIQGNILTGAPVIDMAVDTFLNTPGRLADRLMAGMQAAKLMGGDGRCSCLTGGAQSCGSPPDEFEKSADVGFLVVARIGDTDGVCTGALGCANGDYWLSINIIGGADDPDPVDQLQEQYDQFVLDMLGKPDGLTSQAVFDDDEILGDGASQRTLQIALFDLEGSPILQGGHAVSVMHAPDSAGLGSPGPIVDNGDGTYTVTLTAGTGEGTDSYAVRIDEDDVTATIYPYPTLRHRAALVAETQSISAGAGGAVVLDLMGPSAAAGQRFSVAISLAGSVPGQIVGAGVSLPLNPDRLFLAQHQLVDLGVLGGLPADLDGLGRGTASLELGPGQLQLPVGGELSVAWFTLRPLDFASNALAIAIDP